MIFGTGTDILALSRLEGQPLDPEDPFIKRVYTVQEWNEAAARSNSLYYLATRFAGKEAVFKALHPDANDTRVRLNDIEITGDESGRPHVALSGYMKEYAGANGIKSIHISLSFEEKYALAFAIAEM